MNTENTIATKNTQVNHNRNHRVKRLWVKSNVKAGKIATNHNQRPCSGRPEETERTL